MQVPPGILAGTELWPRAAAEGTDKHVVEGASAAEGSRTFYDKSVRA